MLIALSPSYLELKPVVPDQLRPISPTYLTALLELILNSLISHGLSHTDASVHELENTLAEEHEISPQILRQVISWFGIVEDDRWKMDVDAVVKEIGLGILRNHTVRNVCATIGPDELIESDRTIPYQRMTFYLSGLKPLVTLLSQQ